MEKWEAYALRPVLGIEKEGGLVKRIIVNCIGREARVAVLENGRLVELYMERPEERRIVGNIYKGKVENVLPGMQAAFIDIGMEKNAFLYVDDLLSPEMGQGNGRKPSINELITKGQEIIVQVSKEAFGTKGAKVTLYRIFAGCAVYRCIASHSAAKRTGTSSWGDAGDFDTARRRDYSHVGGRG
jgi:hypothetical protein